jgi:hypothetical protein
MQGLDVPNPHLVGSFRGESGLENIQVKVGPKRELLRQKSPAN